MITNQGGHHECAARTQRQAESAGIQRTQGPVGVGVDRDCARYLNEPDDRVGGSDPLRGDAGLVRGTSSRDIRGDIIPAGEPSHWRQHLRAGYGKPPRRHTDTRWSAISQRRPTHTDGHNTGPNHWRYPAISIQRNLNHQVGAHRLEESDRTDRGHGPRYTNWIGGEGYGRTEGMAISTETISHYPA